MAVTATKACSAPTARRDAKPARTVPPDTRRPRRVSILLPPRPRTPALGAGCGFSRSPASCMIGVCRLAVESQEVAHSAPTEEADVAEALANQGEPNGHPQECAVDATGSRGTGSTGDERADAQRG